MSRRIVQRHILLDASTTATSAGLNVSDFRECVLNIIGSSTANLTVQVIGAVKKRDTDSVSNIDFTANLATRNAISGWDLVEVVDLEDGAAIDGDVGVALSGNVIRLVEVNTNLLDFLAVRITSITAGTATVIAVLSTNA